MLHVEAYLQDTTGYFKGIWMIKEAKSWIL